MMTARNRQIGVWLTLAVGVLSACLATCFSIFGAGMYGSPLTAGDANSNWNLVLVLVLGPFAILPCALLEFRKPAWGGTALCTLAICDAGLIIRYNVREWGFAVHDAGLGTFCLALPMFLLGTLLQFSSRTFSKLRFMIWCAQASIVMALTAYFTWQVGQDGFSCLLALLKGETI